jgi:small subunit ribosomal protein S1
MSAKKRFKYEDIFGAELQEASSEMTGLLEHSQMADISSQEIVKGKVTGISKEEVTVDVGFKSEGQIPVSEFMNRDGSINVSVGDEVDVLVVNTDSRGGTLILSRAKALQLVAWTEIEKAHDTQATLKTYVESVIKGGLMVDIFGIKAFMPASQADIEYYSNLEELVGTELDVKIMNFKKGDGNLVVSRKMAMQEQRELAKKELLPRLKEGAVFKAKVKNMSDYGVFVDIGGMDGFVHISDLSWARLKHPSELLTKGQELDFIVLNYDEKKDRLNMGLKQLSKNPWEDISSKYSVGEKVIGKIVGLMDYGAFMELEPGVEGMIHISEMSWGNKIKKPADVLKRGDQVEAVILDLDSDKKKIALGLKQVGPNPWEELSEKYPSGTRVRGQIKNITDFGIFVNIGEDYDGLVRIADLTWDNKEKEPLKNYKKGDSIEAVVLDISVDKQKISLGVKQLSEDPWKTVPERHPAGSAVEGTIVKVADFGVFVEIEPGLEGLIHISQLSEDKIKKIDQQQYKVGDKITAAVNSIDAKARKISLSVKALKQLEEKENLKAYTDSQKDVKTSLGDLLKGRWGE